MKHSSPFAITEVKGGFKDVKYSESEMQHTTCAHPHIFFIPEDL